MRSGCLRAIDERVVVYRCERVIGVRGSQGVVPTGRRCACGVPVGIFFQWEQCCQGLLGLGGGGATAVAAAAGEDFPGVRVTALWVRAAALWVRAAAGCCGGVLPTGGVGWLLRTATADRRTAYRRKGNCG